MKILTSLFLTIAMVFESFGEGLSVTKTNGTAIGLTLSGTTTNAGTISGGSYVGDGSGLTGISASATNLILSATNRFSIGGSTGYTNNTSDTYSLFISAATSWTITDSNNVTMINGGSTTGAGYFLKAGWRLTGATITAYGVILNR